MREKLKGLWPQSQTRRAMTVIAIALLLIVSVVAGSVILADIERENIMPSKPSAKTDGRSSPLRIVSRGGRPPQLPDYQPKPLRKPSVGASSGANAG